MAMNPMQRKIRNSFLFGFLVAIIVAAIIVGLLFMKIKGLNEEMAKIREKEQVAMKNVYTVSEDVKNGESVRYLSTISIASEKVPKNAITDENLDDYQDENGDYQMVAKVGISSNTPLTTDMVEKNANANSFRLVEYSMISLPSKLEEGDFIDIRFSVAANAADFIVLSKVKVEETTTNTVWLKLSEAQLLLLNNAIVESYIIDGSKLYATQFTNAAQAPLNTTYTQNPVVQNLMNSNKLTDIDDDIIDKVDGLKVRDYINGVLAAYENDEVTNKVKEGFTTEKTTVQAAREELLGDIGY